MKFVFNDGGRAVAGFKGSTGDCVCRSIAIATTTPYQEVYDTLNKAAKQERITKRHKKRSAARLGVSMATTKKHLIALGWQWVPTMQIGSGCKVHLCSSELPAGRLIVRLSGHFTSVIDGVLHDTYDCSRDETRCVYGYFHQSVNR